MKAESRKLIGDAQRKRWAEYRKAKEAKERAIVNTPNVTDAALDVIRVLDLAHARFVLAYMVGYCEDEYLVRLLDRLSIEAKDQQQDSLKQDSPTK